MKLIDVEQMDAWTRRYDAKYDKKILNKIRIKYYSGN